jgi:ATP-dependent RNA helicase RhlB
VSFACEDDAFMIPKIEEAIGRKLPSKYPEPELLAPIPPVRGHR